MVCYRISVPPLFHTVLLLVQGGVTSPINLLTIYDLNYRVNKSKKHFDSCFSVAGPKLWNSLPLGARSAYSNYLNLWYHIAFPPDPFTAWLIFYMDELKLN